LNNLAGIALDRNDLTAAARNLEEALAIRRSILGEGDALTLQSMSNLAQTRWRMGDHETAYALLDEAEKGCRALHVDGEEALAQVLSNRAAMRIADRKYTEAEALLAEAIDLQIRHLGPNHPAVASTLAKQAQLQQALRRPADARASWERAVAIRRAPGGSPRYLGQTLYRYGAFLLDTGARDEARAALNEAISILAGMPSGMEADLADARAELKRAGASDGK
jgi:eukaryotic-like serine/threonine-protein kinase